MFMEHTLEWSIRKELRLGRLRPYSHDLMERLARGKHSSLFQTLVMCRRKRFYNIGPSTYCVLYDKAERTSVNALKTCRVKRS
jgi:hypothetical protein